MKIGLLRETKDPVDNRVALTPMQAASLMVDFPSVTVVAQPSGVRAYSDAEYLAGLVREITPDVPITICQHEPFSGAHVGPGMLGLFFRGVER